MQPARRVITAKSCSCSSCFYKSASENPSFKHMLSGASKIDNLFMGKFLPMREKNLLDRLVKTRALYDNIRSQLLNETSESSDVQIDKNDPADRGAEHTNDALFKLVNLVDKGATRRMQHGDCCSCCSCGSLIKLRELVVKAQRYRDGERSLCHSDIRRCMQRNRKQHRYKGHREKQISKFMKTDHIRSDPYACTNKFKKLPIRESSIYSRRSPSRLAATLPPGRTVQENETKRASKIKSQQRKEYGMGEAIRKSITKIKQTKNIIQYGVNKSIENIKVTNKKIKDSISGSLKNLIGRKKYNRQLQDFELIKRFETTFGVDLSKEQNLDHNKIMEKWACKFECDSKKCTPEVCFREKSRNVLKDQHEEVLVKKILSRRQETLGSSKESTQDRNNVIMGTERKQQNKTKSTKANQRNNQKRNTKQTNVRKVIEINIKQKNKRASHGRKRTNKKIEVPATSNREGVQLSVVQSPSKSSRKYIRNQNAKHKSLNTAKLKLQELQQLKSTNPRVEHNTSNIAISPKSSQVSMKTKKDEKSNKKLSFKTTQQSKERFRKHLIEFEKILQSKRRPISKASSINKTLQDVKKRISDHNAVVNAKPKLTNEHRAVQIRSSFSFEFYKNKTAPRTIQSKSHNLCSNNHETRTIQKQRQTPSTRPNMAKIAQTASYGSNGCGCTLKLKPKKIKERDANALSANASYVSQTKSMQTMRTKLGVPRRPILLPCECVHEKCEPYENIRFIKKRNSHRQSAHTNTQQPHNSKSIPSQTTKQISIDSTEIQPSCRSLTSKPFLMSSRKKYRHYNREPIIRLVDENTPRRQSVRIGSTFSFNVEFHKGDSPGREVRTIDTWNSPRDTIKLKVLPSGTNQHNIELSRKLTQKNKYSRPSKIRLKHTSSQVNNSDISKNIATKHDLRRCFCALKLTKHENAGHKLRRCSKQVTKISGQNRSFDESNLMAAGKDTKVKKIYKKFVLDPNEYEPNVCVPDQCVSHQCLERIKLIVKNKTKNIELAGTSYQHKSMTSGKRSENTKQCQLQPFVKQPKKRRKRSTYTVSHDLQPKNIQKSISQAVRRGSSMGINIEFLKGKKYSQKDFERVLQKSDLSPNLTQNTEGDHIITHKKTNISGLNRSRQNKGDNAHMIKKINLNLKSNKSEIVSEICDRCESQSKLCQKNKATGIRPILKRCFCTLKLQSKKDNKSINNLKIGRNDAIVMPVQVFYDNVKKQQNALKKCSPEHLVTSASENTSFERRSSKSDSLVKKMLCTDFRFNSVKSFLQRSFCAMNVNMNYGAGKKYKLEKYECEPGVCVPGECNPIECQKRIMRRLMKNDSTMTSRMSSCSTSCGNKAQQKKNLCAKKQKNNKKQKPESGFQFQSLPRFYKQAVRISSKFSCNIEFSKENIANEPAKVCHLPGRRPRKVVCQETSCRKNDTRCVASCTGLCNQDSESQSGIAMYHKKSQIKPNNKRCFCTLELLQNYDRCCFDKICMTGEPEEIINFSNKGQNTKTFNNRALSCLEPYECEPNVCVPGQCDPYECLERIKKRNKTINTGVGSGKLNNISKSCVACCTPDVDKKVNRDLKKKQARPKKKPKHVSLPDIESVVYFPQTKRQAVRIGSNFSFDIEFSKESSVLKNKQEPRAKTRKTQKENKVSSSQKSSQDSKKHRSQNEQVKPRNRDESTKTTSFLRRCFCTAKLFEEDKKGVGTLFKRCFCTLKLQKRKNKDTNATMKNNSVVTKSGCNPILCREVGTTPQSYCYLEPYECEPGICVPGECNPKECYERIKRRLLKSECTETTRSMYECEPGVCIPGKCNPYECYERIKRERKLKSVCTICEPYCSLSRCVSTNCDFIEKCATGDMQINNSSPSSIVHEPKYPILNRDHWQGVKIGSKVNFNIEFYKEKMFPNGIPVPKRTNTVKCCMPDRNVKKHLAKNINTKSSLKNKHLQVYQSTESKASSATGKFLKRCFCTLKLHEPGYLGNRVVTVGRVHEIKTLSPFKNNKKSTQNIKNDDAGKTNDILVKKKLKHKNSKRIQTKCRYVNNHTDCQISNNDYKPTKKRDSDKKDHKKKNKQDRDSEHLETILPYEPRHFSKKKSDTAVLHHRQQIGGSGFEWSNNAPQTGFHLKVRPHGQNDNNVCHQTCGNQEITKNRNKKVKFAIAPHIPVKEEAEVKNKNVNRNALLKTLLPNRAGNQRKEDPYTEVKISGKRLKKNICAPKDPKQNTMVTVSGSYTSCEISKRAPKQSIDSCVGTCLYCANVIKNLTAKSDRKNLQKDLCFNNSETQTMMKKKSFLTCICKTHAKHTEFLKKSKSERRAYDVPRCKPMKSKSAKILHSKKDTLRRRKKKRYNNRSQTQNVKSDFIERQMLFDGQDPKTAVKRTKGVKLEIMPICVDKKAKAKNKKQACRKKKKEGRKKKKEDKHKKKEVKSKKKNYKAATNIQSNEPFIKLSVMKKENSVMQKENTVNNKNKSGKKLSKKMNKKGNKKVNKEGNEEETEEESGKETGEETDDNTAVRRVTKINKKITGQRIGQKDVKEDNKKGKKNGNKENVKVHKNYTEVKISGKRLKQNICRAIKPNQNTLVTVSGSYLGCEITKQPPKYSCAGTCSNCGNFVENRSGPCPCCGCNKKSVETTPVMKKLGQANQDRKQDKKQYSKHHRTQDGTQNGTKHDRLLDKTQDRKHDISSVERKHDMIHDQKRTKQDKTKYRKKDRNHRQSDSRLSSLTSWSEKSCKIGEMIRKARKAVKHVMRVEEPCVCGSPACKSLSTIAKSDSITLIKKGLHCITLQKCNKKVRKIKKEKLRLKKLRAKRKKADQIRVVRQKAYDKYMDSQARKCKKSGHALIWAESALDISRAGLNVTAGAARGVYRTATDPRHTYDTLRTMVKKPSKGYAIIKKNIEDSGTPAALKRVKWRFDSKILRAILEAFGPTNFLLHMTDKNPKRRLKIKEYVPPKKQIKKKKKAKQAKAKIPVDFQCNLYMGSLRKKPCLWAYYMCPWFYPHCISLVTLWKQLTDIALFVLAIGVWSPCLIALEAFRMFVCCCLCGA